MSTNLKYVRDRPRTTHSAQKSTSQGWGNGIVSSTKQCHSRVKAEKKKKGHHNQSQQWGRSGQQHAIIQS